MSTAGNDATFRTPMEALEHIVTMLERGERVPYWTITEARAVLDDTRPAPLGTPQDPVDGMAHPCPAPGYAGRHTAVGAGAISSPYVCHGCGTWFVTPPALSEPERTEART